VIEAFTRYDCATRSANTIKRIFKRNETDVVREENIKGSPLPVRTGTLDDKVLREVCRPPKEGAAEIAQKANEAAGQLKAANDALLKKEMAKAEKPATMKASEAPVVAEKAKESTIPSIRPNLKIAKRQGGAPRPAARATSSGQDCGAQGGNCRCAQQAPPGPQAEKSAEARNQRFRRLHAGTGAQRTSHAARPDPLGLRWRRRPRELGQA
jgi:carbonic anhydrase